MIHVDTRRLGHKLPPGWLKKAVKAQKDLDAAREPEAKAEILKKKRLWGELNATLRELSRHKCWYSEAQIAASRMDVDHFRPKGTVKEKDGTARPGYPFLAYDFRNYRLSAQLMNQSSSTDDGARGKHQQFPLADGSPCATGREGIAEEKPLLLDPTDPDDPKLLTFDEEGRPRLTPSALGDPRNHERATRTIDALWLDHSQLAEQRRVEWTKAHGSIEVIDRMMEKARDLTAEGQHHEAATEWGLTRNLMRPLQDGAQPTAPFSSSMRACLRASGREWAERIADRADQRSLVL